MLISRIKFPRKKRNSIMVVQTAAIKTLIPTSATVPVVWLGRSVCRDSRSRPYMEVDMRDMLWATPTWKPTASFSAKISMVPDSALYLSANIPMAINMISVLYPATPRYSSSRALSPGTSMAEVLVSNQQRLQTAISSTSLRWLTSTRLKFTCMEETSNSRLPEV